MLWVKNVGGKLKSDIRYSSQLCYNTFPINTLNQNYIKKMEDLSFRILEEREKYSEMTINQLYNDRMPLNLKKIHQDNDILIQEILFNKTNLNDEKIIIELFNKYETCINNEYKKLF
jgi:hypothetical protein